MAEKVNVDSVILNIMNGLSTIIGEQERLNEAKMVLYMYLGQVQILTEETALSTAVDNTTEQVRLYLVSMAIRGCTPASVGAYRQEYNMFFGTVNKGLADITVNDIRGYLAYCKLNRHNSDLTINNKIRILRGMFTWLVEEEYLPKSPMIKIRENKVEHKVKGVFADEEVTIIKDVAMRRSIRDAAIIDFLHATGVRISEMVALNQNDIDMQERECVVYGKGRKEREVYFGGEAAVHLKEYLASRTDNNPALFVGSRKPHKRLTNDAVRFMLKTLSLLDDRLKGVKINPHKWRRQFVTDLLEKDVPLTLVADLAGHKSINTTKDNYANYSKNKAKQAHKKYIT